MNDPQRNQAPTSFSAIDPGALGSYEKDGQRAATRRFALGQGSPDENKELGRGEEENIQGDSSDH